MAATPSPTSTSAYKFEEGEVMRSLGSGEEIGPSLTPAPSPLPSPRPPQQGRAGRGGGGGGGEKERLLEEVTRLCKERHRLARLHRKAELRVRDSLARQRQSEDVETEVEDSKGNGSGGVDWVEKAAAAREALVAADKDTATNQLRYKLMLEEARTQADTATTQAGSTVEKFLERQKQLVQCSFSPLPPERDRAQVVEGLVRRQREAEEQLRQARTSYFTLALRKQHHQHLHSARHQGDEYQVSKAGMLQLVVETEAYTEESVIQESSLQAHKVSLKHVERTINKRVKERTEVEVEVRQAQEALETLRRQLSEERTKLKSLCEQQARSRRSMLALQPSSRLTFDPLLASDLKEKLEVKACLEEEVWRLKQACGDGNKKGTTSTQPERKTVTVT